MSTSEQRQEPHVSSYAVRLIDGFEEMANKRLAALSVSDLEAVIMVLEHRHLDLANELTVIDDPLESAKKRGAGEFIREFLNYLTVEIMKRRTPEPVEEQESEDE